MFGFDHVLFPIDFSHRCEAARPLVRSVARKYNSQVSLLYAFQLSKSEHRLENAYPIQIETDTMKRGAEDDLIKFFEPENLRVKAVCRFGEPAAVIAQYVSQNEVDLVMMPTLGCGQFRQLLLGSVTAKVLHDVNCPVWTSTHTDKSHFSEHVRHQNMLCAIDLETGSLQILQHAAEIAGTFGANLRIVHAVPSAQQFMDPPFTAEYCASLLDAARDKLIDLQRAAGTTLDVWVEPRPVADAVRAAAACYESDMVIIGRGKLQQKLGRLRTNAYAIIRESPCPVLSF